MIRNINYRPALLFGGTAILLFGLSFFITKAMSGAVNDPQFVASSAKLFSTFSAIFMIFAGIYYIFARKNRPLHQLSAYVHFAVSTVTVLLFLFAPYMPFDMRALNVMVSVSAGVFVLGQFLFLLTILRTLVR